MHVQLPGPQRSGHLEADEAGTQHHGTPGLPRGLDDCLAVGEGAQVVHPWISLLHLGRQSYRRGSGGEQQGAVFLRPAVVQDDPTGFRLEAHHPPAVHDLNAQVAIELGWMKRNPVWRRGAREIVLGEIGPVVGSIGVGVVEGQPALIALSPERLGGRISGGAGADDYNRGGLGAAAGPTHRCRATGLDLTGDVHLPGPLFHPPAGDIVQRRRPERGTGLQAEAGVVPGTTYRVAHDQTLGQRTAVVGADRADGEPLRLLSDQQHGLVAHVARQYRAFGNLAHRYPGLKIGTGRCGCVTHTEPG